MSARDTASPGEARSGLNGPQKAAVLLLALARETAGELLKQLEADEVAAIRNAAGSVGALDAGALAGLVQEFASEFEGEAGYFGSRREVASLFGNVASEAEEAAGDETEAARSVWEELATTSDKRLAEYVLGEHPQAGAVILNRLPADLAAQVIEQVPAEVRNQLIGRMLSREPVHPRIVDEVEAVLRADLVGGPAGAGGGDGAPRGRIADIINKLEKQQVDDILANMSRSRPQEAEAVRKMLFGFEDLETLAAPARGTVFEGLGSEQIIVALHGAGDGLREAVLSSLGARARRMIEAELTSGADRPAREVSAARRIICDRVLELAREGTIELNEAGQ